MSISKPSEKLLGLLPEIERLFGYAIQRGYMGRIALQEEFNLSQREARWVVAHIRENSETYKPSENLVVKDGYIHDIDNNEYIVYTRNGEIRVTEEELKDIRRSYSTWTGKAETVREIASRHDRFSLRDIREIFRVMGIIHDSAPYTDEEIENLSGEELYAELLHQKKVELAKEFEKRQIKDDQVKAAKYDLLSIHRKEFRERLISDLSEYSPVRDLEPLEKHTEGCVGILFPADIHFGKFAELATTGTQYNRNLAHDIVFNRTLTVVERMVDSVKMNAIHVVVGNDWFHIENYDKTTVRGTRQDVDGSPLTLYREGKFLAANIIEEIAKRVPKVFVSCVLSNHDLIHGAELIDWLEVYFRNDPRVEVNVSVKMRTYFKYGNTLIGLLHGHEIQEAKLPLLMAQEAPDLWGKTQFREIFLGHFHYKKSAKYFESLEHQGVRVWTLPSLSATDEWHHLKGFVKSVRSVEGHIIHPTEGRIGSMTANVVRTLAESLFQEGVENDALFDTLFDME